MLLIGYLRRQGETDKDKETVDQIHTLNHSLNFFLFIYSSLIKVFMIGYQLNKE